MVGLAPRVLVGLELKSHDVWVECPERIEDLFGGKFALHLEALASIRLVVGAVRHGERGSDRRSVMVKGR
jgi:hypothetical protein